MFTIKYLVAVVYVTGYFILYIMNQRLYLSMPLSNNSIRFDELECLAFAIQIKLTFVNSTVNSPSIRRLRDVFHIGSDRIRRILNKGLERHYISYDDNGNLIANPIKEDGAYHITLDFKSKTMGQTHESDCKYRIKTIIDIIRKSVLINHINKQKECDVTFQKASLSKKASRKYNCKCHTEAVYRGLSNKRIQSITGVKRAKAKKLIRSLVYSDVITCEKKAIKTNIDPNDFKNTTNKWFRESGFTGYLFHWEKSIYCRVSNIYSLNSNIIKYVK
jgi:hypothetical protein